jgi:hypothetical protein
MEDQYRAIKTIVNEAKIAEDRFDSIKLIDCIKKYYIVSKYCEARFINIYFGNTCDYFLDHFDINDTEERSNKEYWNKSYENQEYPTNYSTLSYYGILCNLNSKKYRIEEFVDHYFEQDLQHELLKFNTDGKPTFFYEKNELFTYKSHKTFLEVVIRSKIFSKICYVKAEAKIVINEM